MAEITLQFFSKLKFLTLDLKFFPGSQLPQVWESLLYGYKQFPEIDKDESKFKDYIKKLKSKFQFLGMHSQIHSTF